MGDYVVVEVGSVVEAGNTEIGEGTTVQVGSRIGSGAKIGKVRQGKAHAKVRAEANREQNCTISHMSVIAPGDVLPDFTTVYSNGLRRIDKRGISERQKHILIKQLAVLRKMIPSNPDKFK